MPIRAPNGRMFRSINDVQRWIEKDVQILLNKIGDKIQKKTKEYIMQNWYRHFEPGFWYSRSFQLISAIGRSEVYRVANGYGIKVGYINPEEIEPVDPWFSDAFGSYQSLDGSSTDNWGNPLTERVIDWVDKGGMPEGLSGRRRAGIHFTEELNSWIKKEVDRMVVDEFKKLGINLQMRF